MMKMVTNYNSENGVNGTKTSSEGASPAGMRWTVANSKSLSCYH